MKNYKMTIEYDGSRYKGWESKKSNDETVSSKIKDVLEKMTEEEIELIGCGKMDAGVHAENYVANFHTNFEGDISFMLGYLYEYLPESIVVKSLEEVDDRFHSRYNFKSKTYIYRINNNEYRSVFSRKYEYHTTEELNISKMKKVAEVLIGSHDFKGFTTMKSSNKSTVKTINSLSVNEKEGFIEIEVNADDFLINMPLILVGTIMEAGNGTLKPIQVEDVLNCEERPHAVPIARAKGLCLKEVEY